MSEAEICTLTAKATPAAALAEPTGPIFGEEPGATIHAAARIMIVDDEPTCVKVVRKYLKDAGYREFLATSESPRAIEIMKEARPDIVLLDYLMPEMDGLEILRRRSSEGALRQIPILVLTASRDEEVKFTALKLGATDFLSKPVDPNDLLPRVHNVLTIKAHQDRLAKLNSSLEEKVLEQTEALRKAYDELKGLDRLKQEFLTLVSHELRTPVAAIHGSLELVTSSLVEEKAEQDELLRIAMGQAGRLGHIIADVEQFLSLTAGKVTPQRAPFDGNAILGEKILNWGPRAQEKGLALRADKGDAQAICSDLRIISNSLDRLIDNAMKFTEKGEIVLRFRKLADRAAFEVNDTGRGIEESRRSRILTPLTIGEEIEHHREGRGLGLAIILRQMQLLGGAVEFESEGVGKGSTFRLLVPLA